MGEKAEHPASGRKHRATDPLELRGPAPRVLLLGLAHQRSAGVMTYAAAAGWQPVPTEYVRDPAVLVQQWEIQAILAAKLAGQMSPQDLKAWQRSPVPTVVLDFCDRRLKLPRVLEDHQAAGRLAAEHFLERGFRHLAYVWLGPIWHLDEELAGFRTAAEAGGARFHLLDWVATGREKYSWTGTGAYRWLAEAVAELPKPVGILVESPWTGLDLLAGCKLAGLMVPEQVALIVMNEHPVVCQNAPVPMSGVVRNLERQGREAAALLDTLMQRKAWPPPDRQLGQLHRIPPEGIVARQSSDVLAVPDPAVAQALRYVWQHVGEPHFSVADVADAIGWPRATLYRAFHKHLGRTIGEEVLRKRMERGEQLLAETDMKVYEVSAACGYTESRHFIRNFRKTHRGLTPKAWQRRKTGEARTSRQA